MDPQFLSLLSMFLRQKLSAFFEKFETVLSAVEVNPKISIKRVEYRTTREVAVTFRGQRLEIVFDGRNRVHYFRKEKLTGRKYKDVVTKFKNVSTRKWFTMYGPGVAKTRKNASMQFTL